MKVFRQRPVVWAVIITVALVVTFAWFVTQRRALPVTARPTSNTEQQRALEPLASLRVTLGARRQGELPANYEIAIEVEGDKTFTMPIRFIRGMQPAEVSPEDAVKLTDAWVKARATGIAQFGVVTPDHGPYLLIDVDSPGAR